MKAIRLGNDIEFVWTVEGLTSVIGTKLVQLFNVNKGIPETMTYEISGDNISGLYKGKDQKEKGSYRLILYVNKGENDMVTLDCVNAFELVGVSNFGIVNGSDESAITIATINLRSTLDAAPVIPSIQAQADWEQSDSSKVDYIKNKPTLFSGDYEDLTNKPTIPDDQIQSDWNQSDSTKKDYIKNKPNVPSSLSELSGDSTHRVVTDSEKETWNGKSDFSGSYTDLTNKPSIPVVPTKVSAFINDVGYVNKLKTINGESLKGEGDIEIEQVQSDWNQSDSSKKDFIKHKPAIPVVPTKVSAFQNDAGYINDVSNKQDKLVSGTNIKTINHLSLLGSGNIDIQGGGGTQVQSDWDETDTDDPAYIKNKPTIPSEVTESTVAGWGFTKNTGDYSKPSTGIPSTDLSEAVQTALSAASSAYQKPSSGIPATDLADGVIPDVSGKADKVQSATNGHLAGLDSNGNLTDSGIASSNVMQKSNTSGLMKNDGTVDTSIIGYVENLNDVVIGTEEQTTTIQSTQIFKPGGNSKHVNFDYFSVIEDGDRIQASAETGYGIYCGMLNDAENQFVKNYTNNGYVNSLDIIYNDGANKKIRFIVKKMDGTDTSVQNAEDNSDILVTRTTPASGLVYDVEELKKKKPSIKALFIGNSVCQDHVAYLPWLLKNIYGDSINFEIYLAYKGGATIKYYVDNIINGNEPVEIFSHAKDTDVWTNTNNFAYANIWTSHGPFDLICYEGYFNHGSSSDGNVEDTSSFMTFIDDLKTRQTDPFKLGYLIHQTYTTSTHTEADAWARILAGAEYAVNNTPVSILFPCGVVTKLVNGDIPQSTLSNDNIHNQQGLPCIMGAYTLVEELARYMGLPSRILNNSLRITQSIETSLNIPGPNGTLQVGTDAQYSLCQNAAIEAIKYSDELFLNISGKANSSDLANKEDKVDIVSASGATLTAEVGKYYTLSNVGTLAITLPTIASGTATIQTVTFYISAGSTPAVTFTSTHSIYYSDGFEIAASSTYEVSAAYNGIAWVVASVKIVIPT